MKKNFLVALFFCLCLNNLSAQVIYHFAHTAGIWGQFDGAVQQWPPFNLSGSTTFQSSTGDTLINSTAYFKIYGSDSLGTPNYFNAALREDSTGKVWWYDYITNSDKLLYDFNLVTGDTVTVTTPWYFGPPCPMVVDSLSTISVLGSPRKTIYFRSVPFTCTNAIVYPDKPLYWIEGIGSSAGLFFPTGGEVIADAEHWLTCYRENAQLAFGNYCYVFLSTNNIATNSTIELFPNPFSDQFEIRFPNLSASNLNLTLYDISGKDIFSESKQSASSATISLPTLPQGFYLLKIEYGNETRYSAVVKR